MALVSSAHSPVTSLITLSPQSHASTASAVLRVIASPANTAVASTQPSHPVGSNAADPAHAVAAEQDDTVAVHGREDRASAGRELAGPVDVARQLDAAVR